MELSVQTQAVLLLTAYFSKPSKDDPRPLTIGEWGRLTRWLKSREIAPHDLIAGDPKKLLAEWSDKTATSQRIENLLGRSAALGLALEKWQRAGIWILTQADSDYPERLKLRLGMEAPPILFGCGNRNILSKGGIAVVGSRHANEASLDYSRAIGAAAAANGYSVVSGGARGIDQAAMCGAQEQEGTVIGVLSESLLRAATSAEYRQGLMSRNVALISPFYPEAGFDVGNAMARNKYIYCLSDTAIVVGSTLNKGGTWSGAIENLRHGWVPLWVRDITDAESGNAELIRRGGLKLVGGEIDFAALLHMSPRQVSSQELLAIGNGAPRNEGETEPEMARSVSAAIEIEEPPHKSEGGDQSSLTLYDLFLIRLRSLATSAVSDTELLRNLDLTNAQLKEWLKRAEKDDLITKLRKPVRYQWRDDQPRQAAMFAKR